jgi:Spx/MgsR family transcriptional regulator
MNVTLYGIPNCDTVKKARTWLLDHDVAFAFHDLRKQGLDRPTVESWLADTAHDVLVNRKGTTWRGLPDAVRDGVTDAAGAAQVMVDHPSVVKRPVLVVDGKVAGVGFRPEAYASLFGAPA